MTNSACSTYFSCLYEEPYPIGNFGDKTHYSVMRAVAWQDETLSPLKRPKAHDFCLIWHQFYHHELTQIAETILMNGLLPPIRFIGLRNSGISLLVASEFRAICGEIELENYETKIEKACRETLQNRKEIFLGVFDQTPGWPTHETELAGIIPANEYRASTYLRNIDNLWQLGLKPFTPTPRPGIY